MNLSVHHVAPYSISGLIQNPPFCWTLSWCIPTSPVVHRSALFALVNSSEMEDKETFEEIMEEQDVSALINRMNASGSTLLHQACINNSPEKAALLMKKGAVVQINRENETPYMTLMKCFGEGEVAAFLEELRAEVDVSGFIIMVEEILMESGIQHVVEASDLQSLF